eukprot:7379756-Prymnesium_polylepis.1
MPAINCSDDLVVEALLARQLPRVMRRRRSGVGANGGATPRTLDFPREPTVASVVRTVRVVRA